MIDRVLWRSYDTGHDFIERNNQLQIVVFASICTTSKYRRCDMRFDTNTHTNTS
jgi:hypothetical protein